jgi:hypothetical protein
VTVPTQLNPARQQQRRQFDKPCRIISIRSSVHDDNRTGATYELPVQYSTIRAGDLRKIKATPDEFGMMTYDPGYDNTASCKSRITYIDGDKGILRYRGYPSSNWPSRAVPGGRLSAHPRRTAQQRAVGQLGIPGHAPHVPA